MPRLFHAGGAAAGQLFGLSNHSLNLIRDLFTNTFRLDVNRFSSALTVFATASVVIQSGFSLFNWISWCMPFLVARISVAPGEKLHSQVLNWLRVHVLKPRGSRRLRARVARHLVSSRRRTLRSSRSSRSRNSGQVRPPIKYFPDLGTTWFFYERRLFAIEYSESNRSFYGEEARRNADHISIACVSLSTEPIKRLFEKCREYADRKTESSVSIHRHSACGHSWDETGEEPIRSLDTVHLDECVKADLVKDIRNYLDPKTQRYYTRRSIPYRRGYLFYGPPGTGKTSLALALAGSFDLPLYVLEMTGTNDDSLERLFSKLPSYCIVLLEDIDAVGMGRVAPVTGRGKDWAVAAGKDPTNNTTRQCTLSGLLNVLDGVGSQEGRIVIMTTNIPEKLDEALVRPGRVDRRVYLGYIEQPAAMEMFRRMFQPDPPEDDEPPEEKEVDGVSYREELEKNALEFAGRISKDAVTPAQVQEFLLRRHYSAQKAMDDVADWVAEQLRQTYVRQPQVAETERGHGDAAGIEDKHDNTNEEE